VIANPGEIPTSLINDLRGEAEAAKALADADPTPANRANAAEAKVMYDNLSVIQLFPKPLGDTEETVQGLWVRQLTLENPSR